MKHHLFLIVVLIFGANKLPEIGGGLGRAIRDFRKTIELMPKDTLGYVNLGYALTATDKPNQAIVVLDHVDPPVRLPQRPGMVDRQAQDPRQVRPVHDIVPHHRDARTPMRLRQPREDR